MADVGVDVERAVGVGDVGDAGGGEPVEQRAPVGAVPRDVPVELVGSQSNAASPATCETCGAQM